MAMKMVFTEVMMLVITVNEVIYKNDSQSYN